MREEIKNKLTAQAEEIHFGNNFPVALEGFVLKKIFETQGDKFIFFKYDNEEIHCGLTAYFHEETLEFKVKQWIGLTEFCLTNFFTEDFKIFQSLLESELKGVIKNLHEFRSKKFDLFLSEKKIAAWTYGQNLPQTLEGFELFIKPTDPVEVTNGSFVIINYVDFSLNSDFVLYYNFYTDEFSAESRINGSSHVSYAFDSKSLKELETKLKENLSSELKEIRRLSK